MAVHIQLRGATAAQWTAANPVLMEREMGVETDTLKVKLGNGTSNWTALSYFTQGVAGPGVPIGGTAGQTLVKNSATDYDTSWGSPVAELLTVTVKNATASAMTKGQAVYISGATGTNVTISLAQANTEATSSKTLGLLTQGLASNAIGTVTVQGLLAGLDTSTATIGDPVWLSPTVAGGLTYGLAGKPVAPNHQVYIGLVSRVSATNGEIFVRPQNGFELDELHNVQVTTASAGQTIVYDGTSQWKAQGQRIVQTFGYPGALIATAGVSRFYQDRAGTLTTIRASVNTAPTGAGIVLNIKKNGTTADTVTIAAGTNTVQKTSTVSLTAGDYLTIDIASVGSTVAGSDLTATVTID